MELNVNLILIRIYPSIKNDVKLTFKQNVLRNLDLYDSTELQFTGNSDLWYRDKDGNWTFFALIVPHVVDSFFTISGFLVTYLSLKGMKAYGGARKFPWWKYYLYRFWR